MTSSDGSPRDPVDPDYAGLFRPESEPAAPPASPAPVLQQGPEGPSVDAVALAEAGAAAEDAPSVPPAAADPVADTGRLFRSQGVVGHDDAVLALTGDRRLRTLERRTDDAPAEVASAAVVLDDAGAPDVRHVIPAASVPAAERTAPDRRASPEAPVTEQRRSRAHRSRSITAGAVYVVVIGVTVVVGLLNAWIAGDLGWPTGLALVASSVYAALTVRRDDDTAAIIIPPVAFLIASLTAGQVFVGSLEGSLLNRAVLVFFTLADNWVWIIGATVAALAIVLVRRRRA